MSDEQLYFAYCNYVKELQTEKPEVELSSDELEPLGFDQFLIAWNRQSDSAKQHWRKRFELGYSEVAQLEITRLATPSSVDLSELTRAA